MLPQHIFQLNPSTFIKTQLGVTFVKRHLARGLVVGHRTEKQVKLRLNRKLCRFQATIAIALHFDRQLTLYPDLGKRFTYQLSLSFYMQRADLTDRIFKKINLTLREILQKMDLPHFQGFYT